MNEMEFSSKFKSIGCLFVQKIANYYYYIEIYRNNKYIAKYEESIPIKIWKKVGVIKKIDEKMLYGVSHSVIINEFQKYQ